ncbi:hypothetical protein CHI12_16685, partial [Terribacillus saccharophilus]
NRKAKFDKKSYFTDSDEAIRIIYLGDTRLHNTQRFSIPMFSVEFSAENETLIRPGVRIQSKDVLEGLFAVKINGISAYESVNNGVNILTIETPDKSYDLPVEIYKTMIFPSIESV